MSVNPGFGGQSFIDSQLRKIEAVRKMIDKSGRDVRLESPDCSILQAVLPERTIVVPRDGVAVLNDSTYGHDVTRTPHAEGLGTTVRLTLLRAPHSPDPDTDVGTHHFTYSLLPGAETGDAVAEGLALNLPLRVASAPAVAPLVRVDHPGVTVESVKLAEDRSGDVVVRLYESRGGRARAVLTTSFPVSRADVTDLLERPLHPADTSGPGLSLALRPFQILTLRLTPA
mgnify:CR=1 FL=1